MPFFKISLIKEKIRNFSFMFHSDPKNTEASIPPIADAAVQRKKAFPGSLNRGSLVVEAAIVLPIFFMMVIGAISTIGIYEEIVRQTAQARDTVEQTAALCMDEDIRIRWTTKAELTPFCLPSGFAVIKVDCPAEAKSWSGRSAQDEEKYKTGSADEYVYVTKNQSVYHTSSKCTHLDLSIKAVGADSVGKYRNSSGGKYHACEKCAAHGGSSGTVYITDDGDKYHSSTECSGLKRTVTLVRRSEVEGLKQCERCAAKQKETISQISQEDSRVSRAAACLPSLARPGNPPEAISEGGLPF